MERHVTRRTLRRSTTGAGDLSIAQVEHATHCISCARQLAWYEQLRAATSALPALAPPNVVGVGNSTLAFPAVGDEGDREMPDRASRGMSVRTIVRAAAVLIGVSAVLVPFASNRASAGSSELRFVGPVVAGAGVSVVYAPTMALADEDSVVVRARFRAAGDRRYDSTLPVAQAGILRRDEDGRFLGGLAIPESAVYGLFAVESVDAQRIDTNFGALFEVLVENPHGARHSLQQKVNDLLDRSWEVAVETQRAITRRFPEDPRAWQDLFALEQEVVSALQLDSLKATHRVRLHSLDEAVGPAPGGDAAGAMFWYARLTGDEALEQKWLDLLVDQYPGHPRAVEQRTIQVGVAADNDRDLLTGLEELWADVGPAHNYLGQSAVFAALRLEDPDLFRVWSDRYLITRPEASLWVARQFLGLAGLEDQGLRRLETGLIAMSDDERRPLDLTRRAFEASRAPVKAAVHLAISKALRRTDESGSSTHLARAIDLDQSSSAYRELADRQIERGSIDLALASLSEAAADPASQITVDTAVAVLGPSLDRAIWQGALEEAGQRRRDRIEQTALRTPLPLDLRLSDDLGRRHELVDLLGGGVSVLAYWSPFCGPALEALPQIEALAKRLVPSGGRVILVTSEPRSPAAGTALRERGLDLETYYDESRELTKTLEQFGTPAFHVLDGDGNLWFRDVSLDEAEGKAAVVTASVDGW